MNRDPLGIKGALRRGTFTAGRRARGVSRARRPTIRRYRTKSDRYWPPTLRRLGLAQRTSVRRSMEVERRPISATRSASSGDECRGGRSISSLPKPWYAPRSRRGVRRKQRIWSSTTYVMFFNIAISQGRQIKRAGAEGSGSLPHARDHWRTNCAGMRSTAAGTSVIEKVT
jgi:hypothetical protein